MKKSLTIISFILVSITAALGCSGCLANFEINQIEREFNNSLKHIDNFDYIDEEDFEQDINQSNVMIFYVDSLGVKEKAEQLKAKRKELRDTQTELYAAIFDLRIEIEIINGHIKEIKDLESFDFSETDKDIFLNNLEEIKKINKDIKKTIGKVYKEISNLRVKYTIGNFDLIISTYNSVQAVLNSRAEKIEKLIEIAADINSRFETAIEKNKAKDV